MGQITGGRVVYGRTVQPAQYESKKAEVEFAFAVAEGEDHNALLEAAATQAIAKAHEMVGLAPKSAAAVSATVKSAPTQALGRPTDSKEAAAAAMNAKDEKPIDPKTGKPKNPVGRPPKPPVQADPAALDDDAAGHAAAMEKANKASEAKAGISTGGERTDPVQEDEELWDDKPAEVVEITDKDLADAATKHNARLKAKHEGAAPGMIKVLIKSFYPADATVTPLAKIAKDKRADFLKKLEALT